MTAAYMTWRRIMAHGESVALRHLNGKSCTPTIHLFDDYRKWANGINNRRAA